MRLDVLIGVISCLGDFVQVAAQNSTRQSLLNDLLANYDSSIAPDYERDTPTRVFVQVNIQNIYSISASSMDYQVDMVFRQIWMDERLNFTHHIPAIQRLELDIKAMDKIWTANTYFANEKTASVHDVTMPNKMIHIYPNATVVYSIRLSMTLSCAMDLAKYPMDEQLCPIKIESYGYTVDNIVYEWDPVSPVKLMTDIEVPQFDAIMDGKYHTCEKTYVVSDSKFACLETNVRFTRKMGYYIVQVFLPSILIVILSWLSFWVELDAVPARISLGVLTLLTMTTQSAGSREALPHVSYIKAIDIWMAGCLVFVFLALMEFAYAHLILRRERKLRTTEERNEIEETDAKSETSKRPMDKCRLPVLIEAHWLDKTSQVAFPTAFAIFNLIFWLYYLLSPDPE